MNLPNKLAILRIILVIPFIFIMEISLNTNSFILEVICRILGATIFISAAITDYYDGQIARKYNMITNLGKLLDPLADKILVISTMILFTKYNLISLWMVLIIIFRELLITGLRAIVASEGIVIAAESLGKWKTTTQMIALIFIILNPLNSLVINNLLMLIPLILTIQSGIEYVRNSKDILNK